MSKKLIRNNWSFEESFEIYKKPLLELIIEANSIHREFFDAQKIQVSSLLSIKTGGCPEDCAYCPQAARYHTDVNVHKLMDTDTVLNKAKDAKEDGASRYCLGAAWREVRNNSDFDKVIDMVAGINDMGMEVCCTLGMLTEEQAKRLKEAGLYAYNHNLDSSEDYYKDIISTRTYKDRLDTLDNIRSAGLTICSGGIIGMGEKEEDRVKMLVTLANLEKHPESVPINALISVEGTPLEDQQKVPIWDMIRTIATAKIMMPASMVRLSAGRINMADTEQALCFLAGANSIFAGDKLLTTPNPEMSNDKSLFELLGLQPMKAFEHANTKLIEETA
ncbi:UNVERIFIED_CONTAM: hypothetical protein GTU68_002057 [Idotea baltica]|nr:hypothetical protein [Idotea baltica]